MRANDPIKTDLCAYVQTSSKSVTELAAELGVTTTTIRRWRARKTASDDAHIPTQAAAKPSNVNKSSNANWLSDADERLIRELSTRAELSLDDITVMVQRCANTAVSRSDVSRCLQRYALDSGAAPEQPPVRTAEPARRGAAGIKAPTPSRRERWGFVTAGRAARDVDLEVSRSRNTGSGMKRGRRISNRARARQEPRHGFAHRVRDQVSGFAERLRHRLGEAVSRRNKHGRDDRPVARRPAAQDRVAAQGRSAGPVRAGKPPLPPSANVRPKPTMPPPTSHPGALVGERHDGGGRRWTGGLGGYALALWLLGAVIYGASTQAFLRAGGAFAPKDQTVGVSVKTPATAKPPVSPRTDATVGRTANANSPTALADLSSAPHAVAAKQPTAVPTALSASAAASARLASASDPDAEWIEVSGTGVNMRAGPSSRTEVVTVQSLGARLRVVSRSGGWVEVIDPESGQQGWIYRSYAKPSARAAGDRRIEAPTSAARNSQQNQ